ncbi:conserved hypothetical protein [Microcystis aeruginosa PCC 9443]|uniref:Uncharacterized protein n=2 Tax=Microcystis aeruginosa TaxID=1126 RepID=I4G0P6_MICAE|nr:conserved hypothetical protein [Microcystis aeruginosa PCC 9443]
MSGTYSIASTNPPESSSGAVLAKLSTTHYDRPMSIRPNKSQTSTGDFLVHCFDLTMSDSDSSLSLTTHWREFPQDKLIALIKCLLILQSLPEDALDESVTQLEDIASFYSNLSPEKIVPVIPASSIRGKLRAIQPVPPIVLEP